MQAKALALLSFFLLLSTVSANTCGETDHLCTIDSNITSNTTWIDGNVYLIYGDINVTNAALTIDPGAMIKLAPNARISIRENARLNANGTAQKPIYFTTCKDQNTYTGTTNINTATKTQCDGPIWQNRYHTAIQITNTSNMSRNDSLSYLEIYWAKNGLQLDQNIGSVHHSTFKDFNNGTALLFNIPTNIDIYSNQFIDFNSSQAIKGTTWWDPDFYGNIYQNQFRNFRFGYAAISFYNVSGTVHDNIFKDFNSTNGIVGMDFIDANVYSNQFENFYKSPTYNWTSGIALYTTLSIRGNIYNNLFYRFNNYAIQYDAGASGNIYNNTFADANIHLWYFFAGKLERNLFVNTSILFDTHWPFAGTSANNAYYNSPRTGIVPATSPGDQNENTGLTVHPLHMTGNRPFLLNTDPAGGARLVNAGETPVTEFFSTKTTQITGQPDIENMDIGYHYDTNTSSTTDPNTGSGTRITCSNNICESTETAKTCPLDCFAVCGDFACTHIENNQTCPTDCPGTCGNNFCDQNESAFTCPLDCMQKTQTLISQFPIGDPIESSGQINQIEKYIPLLGLDESGIQSALKTLRIKRIGLNESVQTTAGQKPQTRILLEVTNITNQSVENIRLFEPIPQEMNLQNITCDYPFEPNIYQLIAFRIPKLLAFETIQIEYVYNEQVSETVLFSASPPFSSVNNPRVNQVPLIECTQDQDCAHESPCILSRCVKNTCYRVPLPDGEGCDFGKVCKQNLCVNTTELYPPEYVIDPIVIFSALILLITGLAIAHEYVKK